MNFRKICGLFSAGGLGYMALELLWRGRTHGSMFLAGGCAFLLLRDLEQRRLPTPVKLLTGAFLITTVELTAGLLFNRDYRVWDYRQMPLNLWGQICLPYTLLWVPVGAGAMGLHRLLRRS